MTFLELMSLIAFTTPFFCSLETGWKLGGGLAVQVGLIVGLVLAIGSFWGTKILFRKVRHYPRLGKPHPGVISIGLSWSLCVALFLWILGSACLGIWLTKLITHHLVA